MSAKKLKPTGNKVLVQPIPPPLLSSGGITLPVAYQTPASEGIVIAVGPGRYNRKGFLVATDLQPGDRVMYSWINAIETELDGAVILRSDQIIAIRK
ncbi:MAG TPA: co-chaperone GroES family protein [Verrucomicrobiae bacterium]|jgi:chaperonin GroES|nr:co-chaperone GroES family protein [Verrucomicrobiae bacterium]